MYVCIGLEFLFSSFSRDGHGAIVLVDPRRGIVNQLADSFSLDINTGK